MKKLLLVISVVLFVAGLFISCNSEVVNSEELVYVTFEDTSKGVQSSTTAGSVPDVNDLYWFYQATKASGSIHTGQTSGWTRVNPNGKGLSGTIGPFSVGAWYFELVGSTSETAPTGTTYDTTKTDHSGWTVGQNDTDVRYVGFSVAQNLNETRSSVAINGSQSAPTYIPISLTRKNNATAVTLDLNGLVLVDSTGVASGDKVWYKVKRQAGEAEPAYLTNSAVSVVATSSGAVITENTTLSFDVTANGEATSITIEVYDDIVNGENHSASETVAQSASITFNAYKGSTVTLSGSLDALAYACFVDSNSTDHDYVAYVVSSNTGHVTFYTTLQDAVNAAGQGDTVTLLQNIDYTEDYDRSSFGQGFDLTGKILDLNGKSITSKNGGIYFYGTDATIKNGTFYAAPNTTGEYYDSYSLFIGDWKDADTQAIRNSFIIEGVTCYGGINPYDNEGVDATIKNSTVYSTRYYIVCSQGNGSIITIESGNFSRKNSEGGLVTPIDGNALFYVANNSYDGYDNSLFVVGGTYDDDPSDYVPAGYSVVYNENTQTYTVE